PITLTASLHDALPISVPCGEDAGAPSCADRPSGRILVLPGVYNTRFQLAGFVKRAEERLPGFDVEVRRWGTPLLALKNLRAHERDRKSTRLNCSHVKI